MKVEVSYFALLREQAGIDIETVDTKASVAHDLFNELYCRYGFGLKQKDLKIAVNDEFVSWDHPLQDGDRIVFIPPVSGG